MCVAEGGGGGHAKSLWALLKTSTQEHSCGTGIRLLIPTLWSVLFRIAHTTPARPFHNFTDFKNAFDGVWHAGLWQVLTSFNIKEGLVQVIQALNENSSSAVLLNSQLGEFFKLTVGVRQGCLLSPILFKLLEKIMQETLHDHHTSISISILWAAAVVNFRALPTD